ncbi:MAG: EAL domain-containing protein [Magnetococcales bacterium]|nr:EAL domain-containing protein [Magnetococcales bacterium]
MAKQKQTILVVDDAAATKGMLDKILPQNYLVEFAKGNSDVFRQIETKKPNLILINITAKNMDGLGLCRSLQKKDVVKHIPIIFITDRQDQKNEAAGFASGAVDFLYHPFNPPMVLARVQTHIQLCSSEMNLQREIAQRKSLEQQLHEQAKFDPLTKLPNRNLFQDRLQQTILHADRNKQPFALMVIDLDRFKWINDTLGHDTGDELLIEASKRIKGVVRRTDTVSRLGGDEFTVILPEILHDSMADLIARKILEQMSLPFKLTKQEVVLSGSVGIAIYPNDGATTEDLIKNADIAMYQAKESGRDAFQFFSQDINKKVYRRLQLEREMRDALLNGGFYLDYQPKVNIASGKIIGMEALVRWNHPTEGILSPKEFIPLAEETGMIVKISAWVLKAACNDAKSWIDAGYDGLKMSVNLSALQFREGEELMALVEDTLKDSGLHPTNLELEITESLMVNNLDQASAILVRLRKMGITISMDDFGTGYSSLALLKKLPIQTLKIDRSFIQNLEQESNNAAFISAIISMAKQLELHVVAEGVENQQQLQILKDHGGTEVQGFLYSPPLGSAAFLGLLKGRIPLGG